jgi:hypothetical protein
MRNVAQARTTRSVQNTVYRLTACEALGISSEEGEIREDHPYPNLWRRGEERGAVKSRVLTEIGRIVYEIDGEHARAAADYVEQAYAKGEIATVAQGEALLRAVRAEWRSHR